VVVVVVDVVVVVVVTIRVSTTVNTRVSEMIVHSEFCCNGCSAYQICTGDCCRSV